jgi:hypothetical protein
MKQGGAIYFRLGGFGSKQRTVEVKNRLSAVAKNEVLLTINDNPQ